MVNSGQRVRRRLSMDVRRGDLVDVCLRLIGDGRWDEVRMAEIADEAQVSKALLYHYFSSKSALYLAAVSAAADGLSAVTRPDPSLPTSQRLRAALRTHLDWIDQHRAAYRAVLQGGLSGNPEVQAIVERSRDEVLQRIADDSDITDLTPRLRVAVRGWVGFLEAASLTWLGGAPVERDELVDLLADMLRATIRAAR